MDSLFKFMSICLIAYSSATNYVNLQELKISGDSQWLCL